MWNEGVRREGFMKRWIGKKIGEIGRGRKKGKEKGKLDK